MFQGDPVVNAEIAAFQHRPERLNPIRVDLATDVFADAILHGFVRLGQILVTPGMIRIQAHVRSRVLLKISL